MSRNVKCCERWYFTAYVNEDANENSIVNVCYMQREAFVS